MRVSKRGGPVVVVGSLHHDIVVRADRQPLRGETLVGREWFTKFGGKGGNQAAAAAQLGAETHLIGAVGDDAFGAELIAGLDAAGVDRSAVSQLGTNSGMSVAIVDGEGDYAAVVVTGANAQISCKEIEGARILDQAALLLLQNEVPPEINLCAAEIARAAGAVVLWNAAPMRPDPEGLKNIVHLLIVNAVEAEQLCGQSVETLEEAELAAKKIKELGPTAVVTAGAAGCAWATIDGDAGRLPAVKVEGAEAHGAGDVFCGALAAHLTHLPLVQSLQIASTQSHRHVAGLPLSPRTQTAVLASESPI